MADLTRSAQIRNAAIELYGDHGPKVSLRAIADHADVSLGLVQHHFATKADLWAACDAWVLDELMGAAESVATAEMVDPAAIRRLVTSSRALARYVSRALAEGSPAMSTFFDRGTMVAEEWLCRKWPDRFEPASAGVREVAAAMGAMHLGLLVLNPHLQRWFEADLWSDEGQLALSRAQLRVYATMADYLAHDPVAASVREGVEHTTKEEP